MVLLSSFLDTTITPASFFEFIEPLKAGARIERRGWDGRKYMLKKHKALFLGFPHIVGDDYFPEKDDFTQATLTGLLQMHELTVRDWVPFYWDDKRPVKYPDNMHVVLGVDEVLDQINKHFRIYKNILIFKS